MEIHVRYYDCLALVCKNSSAIQSDFIHVMFVSYFTRICRLGQQPSVACKRNVKGGLVFNQSSRENAVRYLSSNRESLDSSAMKTRRIKRIVAAVLFSGTLGLALYAKERKRNKLKEYLEGCQRLPVDDDFSSTVGSELFRYKGCIFPGTMIKSGTLKQLETFTINRDDVIVSSFPKSGISLKMLSLLFNIKVIHLL